MEQTNRTILFEEINPDILDLYTLIGNVKERQSISDMELEEIHEKLLVKSFDDFMKKFRPRVYGMVNTENLTFSFSYEKEGNTQNTFCISLDNKNKFFQKIFQLVSEDKKKSVPFQKISDIFQSLLENEKVDSLKDITSKLKHEYIKGDLEKVNRILEHMIEKYDSGIVLLQYFLKECLKKMQSMGTEEKAPLVLKETKGTQVDILKMSEKFKYYDTPVEELGDYASEYLRNRVINRELMNLCLQIETFKKEDMSFLCKKYSIYQDFYAKILKIMWEYIRPLVQSILGVYEFFHQYGIADGKMPPSLLIANCKPESIQTGDNKIRLRTYLETVNFKNYLESNIWYAVIPELSFAADNRKEKIRERFQGTEQKTYVFPNQANDIVVLCNLLAEYRILSFVGIQAKNDTNFLAFEKYGIEAYNASFQKLELAEQQEYIVPCMPNFTIVPREHMEITVGGTYSYQDLMTAQIMHSEKKTIWLEGIYVDASYVAAGLIASCQCPEYLNKYFKGQIMMDFPGVSYRISEKNYRDFTKTVMRKENFSYKQQLMQEIEIKSMGVVFMPCNQGVVVATDRCMSVQNGKKDCIATVQTLRYIEKTIQRATQDFKSELIKKFFQNHPNSVKDKWFSNREFINSILKNDEELTYELNEKDGYCVFKVAFHNINKEKKVNISK